MKSELTGTKSYKILKVTSGCEETTDHISVEEPLEIVLRFGHPGKMQQKTIAITMRTPGDDENLISGFLFNEAILKHPENEIDHFEFRFDCNAEVSEQQTVIAHLKTGIFPKIEHLERHIYTSSSCGVCGKTSIDNMMDECVYILKKDKAKVKLRLIQSLPGLLRNAQQNFRLTGSLHACAIFDFNGKLLHFAEDVGRHNAMDKLCGKLLENKLVPLDRHILVLSGRASFELIHKSCMIACPIVASVGAPSSLAIDTAKSFGISLIGFVKDQSANVYTHSERIDYD